MKFVPLPIPGLVLIEPKFLHDNRGSFIKTYHRDLFLEHGIDFTPREEFHSISRARVLRGMHFQVPPADFGKIVTCTRGRALDVAIDLRIGSPTYGQSWGAEIDDVSRESVYFPSGVAHAFYALEDETVIAYSVSHVYDPKHYGGIRWNSFGYAWPDENPIVSEQDAAQPLFSEFKSPFAFP